MPDWPLSFSVPSQKYNRNKYAFRYYCKNCIRNFETVNKTKKCEFCNTGDIAPLIENRPVKRGSVVRKRVISKLLKRSAPAKHYEKQIIPIKSIWKRAKKILKQIEPMKAQVKNVIKSKIRTKL